jgi:hypothetical protein
MISIGRLQIELLMLSKAANVLGSLKERGSKRQETDTAINASIVKTLQFQHIARQAGEDLSPVLSACPTCSVAASRGAS